MLEFVHKRFMGSRTDLLHLHCTISHTNDPNGVGCQVAHSNLRDRKLKGQGHKTGSGSTNQPRGGSFCPTWVDA